MGMKVTTSRADGFAERKNALNRLEFGIRIPFTFIPFAREEVACVRALT